MTEVAIKIEGVSKCYTVGKQKDGSLRGSLSSILNSGLKGEDFWALKDVSFEVKKGEVIGIIGKNGAGKSTLLKILSQITKPTEGRIEINGRVASLLEVGTGFHPELTGRENIYLNGTILGMTKKEVKVKFDDIVEFSGVEKFIDTPVKHYSSGMYVRLAFAVAAHLEPEILIIDEVLAVGDAEFQNKCLGKMQDVANQGRTVLFVSHNMGAIQNLCDMSVWINSGKMKDIGATPIIVNKYLNFNQSQSTVKLNDRVDRAGNGWVKVTDIEVFDFNNKMPVKEAHSGQTLIFRVHYQAIKYQHNRIQELHIGLPFFDENDKFITTLNNKLSGFSYKNMPLSGYIDCKVDRLPFMNGNYRIGANLIIDNFDSDSILNAFTLNVLPSNYYKNQMYRISKKGGVFISQKWIKLG
tara:strand:+ start:4359 stop:5591 length:1233 start_codon:yes stop_codon:yes gene_type:complete